MLLTGFLSAILLLAAFSFHFTMLSRVSDELLPRLERWGRRRLLLMFIVIVPVHNAEIFGFAAAFWMLEHLFHLGRLEGASANEFRSFVYFSAAAYTSLGFGDIVPTGELRLLTVLETLGGLILIGWSASFRHPLSCSVKQAGHGIGERQAS